MMINNHILIMSLGAIIIGFSPILAKAVAIPPTAIGFYRFAIGGVAIAFYLLIKKDKLHIQSFRRALPAIIGAGFFFAFDLWVWHRSIIYIGAGIATLLANTQVFYLVAIGWLLFGEKPKWYFYPAMLLALVGLSIVSMPFLDFQGINNNFLGVLFGLLTGISYAIVTLCMKKATRVYQGKGPWPIFAITIIAAAFSLIAAAFENQLSMPGPADWALMILYGAGVHFMGWFLITHAISFIPLSLTSLLLLLQPIFATVFGALIYAEPLGVLQIVGLVAALSGVYLSSLAR